MKIMTCLCLNTNLKPSNEWHVQRISALVMLPLWLSLQSKILTFLIVVLPLHIHMGLQEIFEDYISTDTAKWCILGLLRVWVLLSVKIFVLNFFF